MAATVVASTRPGELAELGAILTHSSGLLPALQISRWRMMRVTKVVLPVGVGTAGQLVKLVALVLR